MATFEQEIKRRLVSLGMSESMAAGVFELVKADPANEPLSARWDADISEYGTMMFNLIWFGAKGTALAWIDANLPRAWFRPLFERK